ncbi:MULTISPECIES: hypothetical protein [Sphingomonas]|uniref:hypothetical protein n=1 Tax=Sphingomonas TaxID=13687 RepID=UPI000DEF859D|nr:MULTISPECIES: hypothetical protein [Sphingomonas]
MFMSRVSTADSRPTSIREALRVPASRRAVGWAVALLIELLLVLALLTLGRGEATKPPPEPHLVSIELSNQKTDDTPAPPAPAPTPKAAATAPTVPLPPAPVPSQTRTQATPSPTPPSPIVAPTPIIELPKGAMAGLDIRSLPSAPAAPRHVAGPAAPGPAAGDTPLAEGHGPNGEKLYAAAWYRKPYESELRGYLSTAQPDSFALIACKTVPDFRVADCIGLDEYPNNSGVLRAVLAAAWQFRVRPPQRDNQVMVGEWVRIRIDYTLARKG